ncbi:hypothetical protein BJ878DRAFT_492628 [Calycina marina]|uniref:Uncharacterized protein n=1 Tax=Calycina marina TaxID=1763456 RepID=A0A9P7Z8Q9_9HELO|nr:hypothetical protein BJ878DRAFT_492628 [Calycina marina]
MHFAESSTAISEACKGEADSFSRQPAAGRNYISSLPHTSPQLRRKRKVQSSNHGSAHTTLAPQNYQDETKQWTGVLGVSQTPTNILAYTPQTDYAAMSSVRDRSCDQTNSWRCRPCTRPRTL